MTQTTPLNDLPTIIDGPGDYVSRDGRRVTIRNVREGPPKTTCFQATGSMWKEFRGKMRPRGYNIWHVSGRNLVLVESPKDIVGRYVTG